MPRSMAIVSLTPSINESPFQITPSQSKMNVSTESTSGFLSESPGRLISALADMAIRFDARFGVTFALLKVLPRREEVLAETRAVTEVNEATACAIVEEKVVDAGGHTTCGRL